MEPLLPEQGLKFRLPLGFRFHSSPQCFSLDFLTFHSKFHFFPNVYNSKGHIATATAHRNMNAIGES